MNSTAGVVIAVFALLWFKHPFPSPRPTQPTVTRTPPHSRTFVTAPPPTLSAYRMAPNWSSEALDEILGLQATQQPAVGNTRTLYAFERTEME